MCNFSIQFKSNPDDIMKSAKDGFAKYGGSLDDAGNFSINKPVHIEGNFVITGNTAMVTITKKPFYVNCFTISSHIKEMNL